MCYNYREPGMLFTDGSLKSKTPLSRVNQRRKGGLGYQVPLTLAVTVARGWRLSANLNSYSAIRIIPVQS